MFYGIAHFQFDPTTTDHLNRKDLHAIIAKLRSHFNICVDYTTTMEDDGQVGLAIACLDRRAEKISQMLDKIASYCEEQGIGRIASEPSLIESIDELDEV